MQLPTGIIPRLRCACCLQLLLVLLFAFIDNLLASTTFEMRFRDQVQKLISAEDYHTGLKKFEADSIGTMTYLSHRNSLLIGAKNVFYEVDLNSPFPSNQQGRGWNATRRKYADCLIKGEEDVDCQNFIQVLEYDPLSRQLVVCGTHAQDPMCKRFQNFDSQRLSTLPDVPAVDGKKKCPFDPSQQSTALFAEGALYTATVGDYSGRDSVIYRSNAGQADIVELRSRESDSKWFNTPVFIESFEVEEWVLVFFREVAVEHVNSGDAIYARVGKVCKSDMGGEFVLEEKWTTYQKARLNCSFPGAYPFYFNYLQDVWMVGEGNDRMFYGVFSTGGHEIPGSAVCAFNIADIRSIFNEGQFKERMSGNWYAVPRDREPQPRPGNCSLNSKLQSDLDLGFITEHPLMDQSVPSNKDPSPIFDLTRADYRLTQIAVYKTRGKNGTNYNILFLGTENGLVLKVALIPDGEKFKSNLLEKIYVTPRDCQERVKEMEIIKTIVNGEKKDMLMVVTNTTVVEVPLQRCTNYTSRCSCIQDPFCVWNTIGEQCYELLDNTFDEQDVEHIQDCEDEKLPVSMTTPAECVCEPPSVPSTEPHVTTVLPSTFAAPHSSSAPIAGAASTVSYQRTSTPQTTTIEQGRVDDEKEVETIGPIGGSGKEVNEASTGANSATQQVLLVVLIIGWALFLLTVPVILFLVRSNRRKGNYVATPTDDPLNTIKQSDGTNHTSIANQLHLNGNSTYHHLFPPPSPQESSTDPPTLKRPSRTPSSTGTLERGTPQGGSITRSPSKKKPPVPPKRTNSFLTHDGPRMPNGYGNSLKRNGSLGGQPNGYVRRQNSQNSMKNRQNSTSSSTDSVDPPPPYRPLSGSEDEQRRRRPSGASNNEVPSEYRHSWYKNQNRAAEQSV